METENPSVEIQGIAEFVLISDAEQSYIPLVVGIQYVEAPYQVLGCVSILTSTFGDPVHPLAENC
jgi:hypothetical protein